jgi:hypothetical protein
MEAETDRDLSTGAAEVIALLEEMRDTLDRIAVALDSIDRKLDTANTTLAELNKSQWS